MPRNLSYRRQIEAIRTVRMKRVVTKLAAMLGVRTKTAKGRTKP